MWSEGGWTGPDYKVAYAISDSPFGPFNRIGEVLRQNFDIANGAGSPLDHACAEFGRLLYRVPSPAGRGQDT